MGGYYRFLSLFPFIMLERGTSNRAFLVLHFYFALYLIYFLLYFPYVFVFVFVFFFFFFVVSCIIIACGWSLFFL